MRALYVALSPRLDGNVLSSVSSVARGTAAVSSPLCREQASAKVSYISSQTAGRFSRLPSRRLHRCDPEQANGSLDHDHVPCIDRPAREVHTHVCALLPASCTTTHSLQNGRLTSSSGVKTNPIRVKRSGGTAVNAQTRRIAASRQVRLCTLLCGRERRSNPRPASAARARSADSVRTQRCSATTTASEQSPYIERRAVFKSKADSSCLQGAENVEARPGRACSTGRGAPADGAQLTQRILFRQIDCLGLRAAEQMPEGAFSP